MNKYHFIFFSLFLCNLAFSMEQNNLLKLRLEQKEKFDSALLAKQNGQMQLYLSELEELAQQNNPYAPAQYRLARFYLEESKDDKNVNMYLNLAANNEYQLAEWDWGMHLLRKNQIKEGMEYIKKAAQPKFISAINEQGIPFQQVRDGYEMARLFLDDVTNNDSIILENEDNEIKFKIIPLYYSENFGYRVDPLEIQIPEKGILEELRIDLLPKNKESGGKLFEYSDPFESIINLIKDGKRDQAFTELRECKDLPTANTSGLQSVLQKIQDKDSWIYGICSMLVKGKNEKTKLLLQAIECSNSSDSLLYELYKQREKEVSKLMPILFTKKFDSDFQNQELNNLVSLLQVQHFDELCKTRTLENLAEWIQTKNCSVENRIKFAEYLIKNASYKSKNAQWKSFGFKLLEQDQAYDKFIDMLFYGLYENNAFLSLELLEHMSLYPDMFSTDQLCDKKKEIFTVISSQAKKNKELSERFGNFIMSPLAKGLFDNDQMFQFLKNLNDTKAQLLCAQMASSLAKQNPETFIKKAYDCCSQETDKTDQIICFAKENLDNFAIVYNSAIPDKFAAKALEEYIYSQLGELFDSKQKTKSLLLRLKSVPHNESRLKNNTIKNITMALDVLMQYHSRTEDISAEEVDILYNKIDCFKQSAFFKDLLKSNSTNNFFLEFFHEINYWIALNYCSIHDYFYKNFYEDHDTFRIDLCNKAINCFDNALLCCVSGNESFLRCERLQRCLRLSLDYNNFLKNKVYKEDNKEVLRKIKEDVDFFAKTSEELSVEIQTRIDDALFHWLQANIDNREQETLELYEKLVENEYSIHYKKYFWLVNCYRNGKVCGSEILSDKGKEEAYLNKALETGCPNAIGHMVALSVDQATGTCNEETLEKLFPIMQKCEDVGTIVHMALSCCIQKKYEKAEALLRYLEKLEESEDAEFTICKLISQSLIYYNNKQYKEYCTNIIQILGNYNFMQETWDKYGLYQKLKDITNDRGVDNGIRKIALALIQNYLGKVEAIEKVVPEASAKKDKDNYPKRSKKKKHR